MRQAPAWVVDGQQGGAAHGGGVGGQLDDLRGGSAGGRGGRRAGGQRAWPSWRRPPNLPLCTAPPPDVCACLRSTIAPATEPHLFIRPTCSFSTTNLSSIWRGHPLASYSTGRRTTTSRPVVSSHTLRKGPGRQGDRGAGRQNRRLCAQQPCAAFDGCHARRGGGAPSAFCTHAPAQAPRALHRLPQVGQRAGVILLGAPAAGRGGCSTLSSRS